jgi:hypothetical protein
MAVPASRLGEARSLPCGLATGGDRRPTDPIDGPRFGESSAVWRSLARRSFSHAFSRNLNVRGRGDHRRHLKLGWITWLNPQ